MTRRRNPERMPPRQVVDMMLISGAGSWRKAGHQIRKRYLEAETEEERDYWQGVEDALDIMEREQERARVARVGPEMARKEHEAAVHRARTARTPIAAGGGHGGIKKNPTDVKRSFPREEEWYVIRDAIARMLFVTAWAELVEERGRSFSGEEVFGQEPTTVPNEATLAASAIADAIEDANKASLVTLFCRGEEADIRVAFPDGEWSLAECDLDEEDMEEFGHDLAMMAMGTGVSWFDGHADFPLKVPYFEFSQYDLPKMATFIFEDRENEGDDFPEVIAHAYFESRDQAGEFILQMSGGWERDGEFVYSVMDAADVRDTAEELRHEGYNVDLSQATVEVEEER